MLTKNFLLDSTQRKRTTLDKEYYNHINNILNSSDEEKKNRWEIYDLIIIELMKQENTDYFKELKYRLTDGENPNEILLEFINRNNDDMNSLVWSLKDRLEQFLDEDIYDRFFT